MQAATGRRVREVRGAQSEYRMMMVLLLSCALVVVLFAGVMLQATAASVSNHLAHIADHDYQVTTGSLLP